MPDRTKLLVHLRRLSTMFENAIANGPDGTLEGKFKVEHPIFIHHACAFYLAGCLAFLEGEDGSYSWNMPSASNPDFDSFVANNPAPPKTAYGARGINKASTGPRLHSKRGHPPRRRPLKEPQQTKRGDRNGGTSTWSHPAR